MKALPLAFLVTILVPAVAPACLTQTKEAAKTSTSLEAASAAFRDGYAAALRNDFLNARISFEQAVRLAPKIAAGHSALGSVLLALGDTSAAIKELETAHSLDTADASTLLNLCVAYSRHGDNGKSVSAYKEFESGVSSPFALPADAAIAVATAFSVTGGPREALEVVQHAIDADENNAQLQDTFGVLLAQQKDYASAEIRFRKAIEIDQSLASAHYHLGSVASATNRAQDALAEFNQAHTLDPDNVQYVLDLADALMRDHRETAAIELLRAEIAKPGSHPGIQRTEAGYRLALALQAAGNVKEAMPLFTEVITARPDDAEALTNAALAHVQLGDAKGGIPLYLRALKLTPSNPTLLEDLGVAYLQQADLDHALEQFRAGLLVDDQSPQLHYDLGLALKLKDDLAAAVPEFERAAALDPQLPDPAFTLGIIYMQQGKFGKSAASFESALALRPDDGEAWATLGSVYQQMQQPDKAIAALRRAIELMPQQPSPHITLAAVLASQGHREEAAAERKAGAALSRAATNRQKANFGLDSGTLLMKRGQTAEALVQFQDAVEADPNYAAPHLALAEALEHSGRKAEAAEERRKAAGLASVATPKP